jgi:putative sigma-54 modulation protein
MYAAIDLLADKLNRQVLKHKERMNGLRHDGDAPKRQAVGND